MIWKRYRGIRPAAGYPVCPDRTRNGSTGSRTLARAETQL
ncbi:MAG: vitamin B12 dependent-methionine synthase activation domain-containing protein [Blastocatellia bacterium]